MKYLLETPRLLLREFKVEDAEHMYQLNLDPEVIRYKKPIFVHNYDDRRL